MNETVFAPALFFGSGLVMVAALSLTMTVLRGLARIYALISTSAPTPGTSAPGLPYGLSLSRRRLVRRTG